MKFRYIFETHDDFFKVYEGEEIIYEIDIEEIKYEIIKDEIKKLELDVNTFEIIDLFNNMDLWKYIINEDELKSRYEEEAMKQFIREKIREMEE